MRADELMRVVLGHKVVMLAATRVLPHLSTQPRRGLITKVSHRV